MARLGRFTQKIFGSSASINQLAQFGSLANSTPTTYSGATVTPALVQNLSNFLTGWFGAVIGSNSPAIEDMNSICYLYSFQLAYLMQAGIPEWDSGTTYFTGSIVQDGTGKTYVSLTDNNLNNALSVSASWKPNTALAYVVAINPATQSPYTLTAADSGKTFLVNSANGAMQFNLPAPAANTNFTFTLKDVGGSLTNFTTLHRNAAEQIEGLAADYVVNSPYFQGTWETDGTNWWRVTT